MNRTYAGILLLAGILALSGCGKAPAGAPEAVSASGEDIGPAEELQEEPAPEPAAEALPEEPEEEETETVRILMNGDILLHDRVEEAALRDDGTYDFSFLFDRTREKTAAADLAIVNQEVIIGGEELYVSGYPSFNAPYEIGDALAECGYDVILQATNHALDRGSEGIRNDLAFWEENYPGIEVAGINGSFEEQERLRIAEKNGIRIAVLNYTCGTNGIPLPDDMPYAVNYLEEEMVVRDLRKAEEEADFTVVCPHWGAEYYPGATEDQRYWLPIFYENGADLVLGGHPHVIGPVEWYEDMLVYFSVGNFVSWTAEYGEGIASRMVGGIAEVTVGRDADGKVKILEYGIDPVICHVASGEAGVCVYPIGEYSEELAASSEIVLQDPDFSYAYCVELCDTVWGDLWRKDRKAG